MFASSGLPVSMSSFNTKTLSASAAAAPTPPQTANIFAHTNAYHQSRLLLPTLLGPNWHLQQLPLLNAAALLHSHQQQQQQQQPQAHSNRSLMASPDSTTSHTNSSSSTTQPQPDVSPSSTANCSSKKPLFRPWMDEPMEDSTDLVKQEAHSSTPGTSAVPQPSQPATKLTPSKSGGSKLKNKRVITAEDEISKQASAMELVATNLGKTVLGHRCIYCGKLYSRKYGLKIHLRTHTGFKPLKCGICHRPFGDPSNLNKHTRLHNDELSHSL